MVSKGTISVTVDSEAAVSQLTSMSDGLKRVIIAFIDQGATMTKDMLSDKAPEGVAGLMGQGLKGNMAIKMSNGGLSATIGPNDSIGYAASVENGSRPHMPPAFPGSALDQWCDLHGMNTWAVAMSISRKGTKAHPYVRPTYAAMQTKLPALADQQINNYIARYA